MNFIANMSIRKKLAVLIMMLMAMMLCCGAMAIHQLLKEETLVLEIKDNLMPSVEMASKMSDTLLHKRLQVLRLINASTDQERQGYISENQRLNQLMLDLFNRYELLVSSPEERQNFDLFKYNFREYDGVMTNEFIPSITSGDRDKLNTLTLKLRSVGEAASISIDGLMKSNNVQASESIDAMVIPPKN